MSYEPRKGVRVALGGDPIADLLACGKSVVGTAVGGAVDPYFPEIMCRISQLQALSKDRTPLQALLGKKPTVPVPACTRTAPGIKGGIGLERAVKPMRAAVYVNQHPITAWLGLAAILGVPIALGYMIGRRSR